MVTAHHQPTPVQILRDRRGVIIGWLKEQFSTGKVVAQAVNCCGSPESTSM